MARPSNLETRLRAILDPTTRRQTLSRVLLIAAASVALLLVAPLGVVRLVAQAEPLGERIVEETVGAEEALRPAMQTAAAAGLPQTVSADDPWSWRGTMEAGSRLTIKGLNGSIRAQGGDGRAVQASATIQDRRGRAGDLQIEVVERGGNVTICPRYPGQRPGCDRVDTGGDDDYNVVVNFEVTVPQGVRFDAETVNGSIEARGLSADAVLTTVNGNVKGATRRGNLTATTVNGNVDAQAEGVVVATTVNGNIDANLGALAGRGGLTYTTVNGDITLYLPTSADATVEATTQSGSIRSDFPLDIQRNQWTASQRASGRLGQGGRDLTLTTVNGSIALRRGSRSAAPDATPAAVPRGALAQDPKTSRRIDRNVDVKTSHRVNVQVNDNDPLALRRVFEGIVQMVRTVDPEGADEAEADLLEAYQEVEEVLNDPNLYNPLWFEGEDEDCPETSAAKETRSQATAAAEPMPSSAVVRAL